MLLRAQQDYLTAVDIREKEKQRKPFVQRKNTGGFNNSNGFFSLQSSSPLSWETICRFPGLGDSQKKITIHAYRIPSPWFSFLPFPPWPGTAVGLSRRRRRRKEKP